MQMLNRKKIAFYYPYFTGGGAEAVGLWMIQALMDKYDITLFTVGSINIQKLNSMYGTNISTENIKIHQLVPKYLTKTCYFLIANSQHCRHFFLHLLLREFKKHCHLYDLSMSGYNAIDMGRKGIQYIHWPGVFEEIKFYHKLSNFSEESLRQNISLVNSEAIFKRVEKAYNIDATVLFPPVVIPIQYIPWEEKEDSFICSGRIVKAKEPHRAIKILKRVREAGFDIKLHITGGGGGIYGWQYKRTINKLVAENSSWITLHENRPYEEYATLLSRCKYGIHYKKEPFGISIAEMVKAGAIPFVRSIGGQVEIVGDRNQELLFNSEDEAVEKIIATLKDENQQKQLIASLDDRKYLFSTEKFISDIQGVVDTYFEDSLAVDKVIA